MAAVQGVSIYWTSTDQFPFLKKAFKCFALVFAASIGSISFLSLISTEDYIDIGIDEKFYLINKRIVPVFASKGFDVPVIIGNDNSIFFDFSSDFQKS